MKKAEDLDYKQLSQAATINVSYALSSSKKKTQNLNLNYSLNDVVNEQGGVVRIGDASTFHNLNVTHAINFVEQSFTINTGLNGTLNTIGREESVAWGPNIALGKKMFDKKLGARFSVGYNHSEGNKQITQVLNLKTSLNYVLKEKHNFNLNAIQLFRSKNNNSETKREFTATLGYSYSFGVKKPKISFNRERTIKEPKLQKTKEPKPQNDTVRIKYRRYDYLGIPKQITPQLLRLPQEEGFAHLMLNKKRKIK